MFKTRFWTGARRTLITTGLPAALLLIAPGWARDITEHTSNNWLRWSALCLLPLLIVGIVLLALQILRLRRAKRRDASQTKAQTQPAPSTIPSPAAYLEHRDAPGVARRFDLDPTSTAIGRGESNDLIINEDFPNWETVSQRHAQISRQAIGWVIEDNNSRNGVYVNGKRTGHNLLRDGWQLDIGGVVFTFHANEKETER